MRPRYLPTVHYGGPLLATAHVHEVYGDCLDKTYATPAAAWRRAARELEDLVKRAAAEAARCRRVAENLKKSGRRTIILDAADQDPSVKNRKIFRPVRGKPRGKQCQAESQDTTRKRG